MNKFNGRKITSATLHESIHTPATGELKRSLSSKPNATDKAVDMTYYGDVVEIVAKGQTILVPFTGFKSLVLAPEEPKASTK